MDGTDGIARLGQKQRFGVEGALVEDGGRLLAHDHTVDTGRVAKLVIGQVIDHIIAVKIGATGVKICLFDHLSGSHHDKGTGDRHFELCFVFGGEPGHPRENSQPGYGLDIVHILRAGDIENFLAHFGGPANCLIDRLQPGNFADEQLSPRLGPVYEP